MAEPMSQNGDGMVGGNGSTAVLDTDPPRLEEVPRPAPFEPREELDNPTPDQDAALARAETLMWQREERHKEQLASKDAEIKRLRAEVDRVHNDITVLKAAARVLSNPNYR